MIDQERQASFKYGHFDVVLCMSSKDVLSIAVENSETLEKYNQTINREYISQQDPFFQSVFERAQDVYDYLRVVSNEIVIEEEVLLFNFLYGNNKKVRRISIQLLRGDIDRVELAHLKADKMKELFTAQLLQKDSKIQELKQKDEEITQTLLQMKDEIRAEKAQNRQLVKTLRVDFQSIKDELQIEKAKSKELAQTLKAHIKKTEIDFIQVRGQLMVEKKKSTELAATLKANSVKSEIELKQIKKELQAVKDRRIELAVSANTEKEALAPLIPIVQDLNQMDKLFQKIDHHPDNDQKRCYKLINLTGMSARITRVGDSGFYNFVNKCEILPNQKTKYSITINKTKDSDIMVGFCTGEGLGKFGKNGQTEVAYYSCSIPGYLYQDRTPVQFCLGNTVVGETVDCVADLASCKLSWWKKGSQIAECMVPAGMRNKPIYISIILCQSGDEVDLCV